MFFVGQIKKMLRGH